MSDNEKRLEAAKRNVLLRMSGCPQPDCHACRANREAIEELVEAARAVGYVRADIALALRDAQRAYLADRGNDALGRKVAEAAAALDRALGSQNLPNEQGTDGEDVTT